MGILIGDHALNNDPPSITNMYNKVDHYVYIPLFFIKRVSLVSHS